MSEATELTPFYTGEVQFRRYSDTSTQGQQVVFALADRDELQPFIGKEGKRFMAVFVEIGDDEQPIQPQPKKDQRGPLCREACDYCAMPEFQRWVAEECACESAGEDGAKKFVLFKCGVESRKELDTNAMAGGRFVREVRIPFMRWQRDRREK